MTTYQESFDQLHFTECTLGPMLIADGRVEVRIDKGLVLLSGHPAFEKYGSECPAALLVFEAVRKYYRKSIPYIGPPSDGKFGPPEVDSREFSNEAPGSFVFELEGVTLHNPSWTEIEVVADKFELIICK